MSNSTELLGFAFSRVFADLPDLGRLSKRVVRNTVRWQFTASDGKKLNLTTRELMSPRAFSKACFVQLGRFPKRINFSREVWHEEINRALAGLSVET